MLARWAVPAQLRSIPRRVASVCAPSLNVLNSCGNEKLAFAVYKSGCSGCIRGCTTAARTSQCQERKPCGYCSLWPKEARRGRHILALQSSAANQLQDGPRSRWRGSQGAFQPVPQPAFENEPPLQIETGKSVASLRDMSRSPQALVKYLDNYIVGQTQAKRAVAVALRQRWRRRQVADPEMRADITPKNILLIGPTGVGKTEIARRLAKHLDAPFVKVEATKYTEVGFHGRDVDQIIKDLVEVAVKQKRTILESQLRFAAKEKAEAKVLEALAGKMPAEEYSMWLRHLRRGSLDNRRIQIDMPMVPSAGHQGVLSDIESAMRDAKDSRMPQLFTSDFRVIERRYVTIKEALSHLTQVELDTMITKDMVIQQAVEAVEQEGIVFIDEIDKICSKSGSGGYHGPDASDEGVQRDLLPLLEGSTVTTRYGDIRTDYILFIASGAFHSVRPSDMLAELQGRLPVRVTLNPLSEDDFRQILTRTRHNLIEQHKALLATEGIVLDFRDDAISEVARVAWEINSQVENIGARRLHTVIEKVLGDINLNASLHAPGATLVIDRQHVLESVSCLREKFDHSKFIL